MTHLILLILMSFVGYTTPEVDETSLQDEFELTVDDSLFKDGHGTDQGGGK